MKAPVLRRRPGRELLEHDTAAPMQLEAPAGEADAGPSPASSWTAGPALATKAMTGVLYAGLVCGPLALLLGAAGVLGGQPAPPAVSAPAVDRAGEQAAVGEFAGRFVTMWLTGVRGQEQRLAPYVGSVGVTFPDVAWTVGAPSTADVHRAQDGTWTVLVALDVTGPAPAAPAPAASAASSSEPTAKGPVAAQGDPAPTGEPSVTTRRYFQVPVRFDAAGLIAVAYPAPVAAPPSASAPPPLVYREQVPADDPAVVTSAAFLTALLTGQGDITRYLAPGTVVDAVDPPMFTAIEVTDVATDTELTGDEVPDDGTSVRALVDLEATGPQGTRVPAQYPLTVTVRGGRWEITSLDPAPALKQRSTPAPAVPAAPGGATTTPPNPND